MKVVLGVTGSVAAKLTPKMAEALLADQHEVKVVATDAGLYFFESEEVTAQGVEVMRDKDEWPEGGYIKSNQIPHIDLGDWADYLLLAPVTYNTLGKIVGGIADNFLTCIVAAWPTEKPLVLAPAMNTRMWSKVVYLNLIERVHGIFPLLTTVGPIRGRLACGTTGIGAMAHIRDITAAINNL